MAKNYCCKKKHVDFLKAILDESEAEVIASAQQLNADLVLIDNREPRIFARAVSGNKYWG